MIVQLNEKYNRKLSAARKAKVNTGGFVERLCAVKVRRSKEEAGEMEAEDEFVVVEREDGDVDLDQTGGDWDGDDWDM
ncbi:hypothetical protein NHQ30_011265 [Ciborinia camelliae]|nr:hypothetical protein NHQ30_011265 [Ciborinia camelliae]